MGAEPDRRTFGITTAQLREIADEVDRRWPGAVLVKNQVGNLAVVGLDGAGHRRDVAWCDLRFGGVHPFDDDAPGGNSTTISVSPTPLQL